MNTFIVRVYRYDNDKHGKFVGTVEESGVKNKQAFSDMEELWNIMFPNNSEKTRFQRNKEGRKIRKRGVIE